MSQSDRKAHRARDAATLLVLGAFFTVLSVLVLLGSFWSEKLDFPVVVNIASGVLLMVVGLGMSLMSWHLRRQSITSKSTDEEER